MKIKSINMKRIFLIIVGFLQVMSGTAMATEKPNVIFISVDDLNDFPPFERRYPDALTPNLNKLANSGIVFANAHAQYVVCAPSRASLMSGLHPSVIGRSSDNEVEKRARELGTDLLHSYFRKNGYKAMAVGKILHRHVPEGSVDTSGGRGGFTEGTGKLKKNWHQNGTITDWAMAPERDDQLPDHKAAEWAISQLEAKHDKPFFLMVGFLRPHVPWYVPKKWFDLYDKDKLTLPPYRKDDLDDIPQKGRELSIHKAMPRTEWAIENHQWRNILHAYLACVSFADHQVGKVLNALEASSYKDNTIVVLWSDHGYHMGEKNTFQKHSLWERSSHVPLIFAGPEIEAGQRCDRVVSLLDIYPTLVEMCGLPENTRNQGHSLVPLMKDPDQEWTYPAITGWREDSYAIQNERYRYIRYGDGSEELYDHQNDPNEWTNVAGKIDLANIKTDLARHIPERHSENDH